jgi:hypothetical protein
MVSDIDIFLHLLMLRDGNSIDDCSTSTFCSLEITFPERICVTAIIIHLSKNVAQFGSHLAACGKGPIGALEWQT